MEITRLGVSCRISSFGLAMAILLSISAVQAETLVCYDMQTIGKQTCASTVASCVTVSNLIGSGLNSEPGKLENPKGTYYTTWSPAVGGGSSAIEAIYTQNAYLSFTVTPKDGEKVTLSELSFNVFAATGGPSARQLYVLSDKTGFDDAKVLFTASTVSGEPLIPYNTSAGQKFSIDLSGNRAFAGMTDSLTFRFYVQTPDAGQSLAFSDIQISDSSGDSSSSQPLSLMTK